MRAVESGGLLLNGLDGSNPLGFLAAVGVLRTAAEANSSVDWRVRWGLREGTWSPALVGDATLAKNDLLDLLLPALKKMKGHPAFAFADDLTLSCAEFRREAQSACQAAEPGDRRHADFMAAFGCDIHPVSAKDPRIQDTALRTMSGAGHQHFIGSMRELVEETDAAHLRASLFEPWQYGGSGSRAFAGILWTTAGMPCVGRAPSGDPVRTMRGANRLAVEAHCLSFRPHPGNGGFKRPAFPSAGARACCSPGRSGQGH